jgi:hypothetical protein
MAIILFSNATATANSAAFVTQCRPEYTTATIAVWGGFGAGTLAVKMSPDGGTTWLDFPAPVSMTTAGTRQVSIPQGVFIRGELTGAAGASLFCTVYSAD